MIKKYVIAGLWSTFCLTLAFAQDKKLPLDSSVRMGTLPNGFSYFIKTNKQPEKRATLYLANKVGSILEEENERGLAHFLEHMNFNGTKHYPENELIHYLERAGVKFGADLNAYTAFDETVYQLPLPTDDTALWKNGMQIMRDWAADATLDSGEYEKERGVILEEKRLTQRASNRMQTQFWPTLFNFSRYAVRLPIGEEEVIRKADLQQIRNFYKKWYRPDLQALIVVGDVDIDRVEEEIKSLFGDLNVSKDTQERPVYAIDLKPQEGFVKATDKENAQYQVEFFFKREKQPLRYESDFKKELINDLANSLLASRLQEVYRRNNQPYFSAQASAGPLIGNLEAFNIGISLTPGKLKEGFISVWMEIERIKRFGFTDAELKEAKERVERSVELMVKEQDKMASTILADTYLRYFLEGRVFMQTGTQASLILKYLPAVTLTDVSTFVNSYLAEADRTILVLGPDKDDVALPEQTDVKAWMAVAAGQDLKRFEEETPKTTLLDHSLVPGKIVKKQEMEELGLRHWVLSNGMHIYVKPTNFKNDEVLFLGSSPGGSSLYQDADYRSASNATAFVVNSGLGKLNQNQLVKVLNGKAVRVEPYIGERSEGFSGASSGKDLETALQMIHLYMAQARLDTARFSQILERSKTAMLNRVDDPARAFSDTISNVLGNYHIRRKPADIEALNQIDSTRLFQIFKERFSDAADFTFVFTGSVQPDSLQSMVEYYLGSLPALNRHESALDLNIRVPEGKIRKDLFMGSANKATVQMVISGTYDYEVKNNLYLDVFRAALSFRLTERLREQEGGVYSPSVQLTKAKQPIGFYTFTLSFDCNPQRMESLISAVKDEWSHLHNEGITMDDLQKFRAEEARALEVGMQSNTFWLNYLEGQLKNEEPLREVLDFSVLLDQLTLENIKKQAGKWLKDDNEIMVTLKPESLK
ncbi:MAG TPA: insulinase family protein [Pseudosphingobacterium sp.]|nr:insulinase family protein [Pseudosphingobacterium sp.]